MLARYNGGKKIPLFGADGKPLSGDEVLKSFADPIRSMGAQKAHSLLAGQLDDGTINFLLQGRSGVNAALKTAAPDAVTNKQAEDDRKLEQTVTELTTAFDAMKRVVLEIAAPSMLVGLKVLVAWMRFIRNPLAANAADDRDKAIRDADAEYHATPDDPTGAKWLAGQDGAVRADLAMPLVQFPGAAWATHAPGAPMPTFWKPDQIRARLAQLLSEPGMTPANAAAIVSQEMAAGRAPDQKPVVPLGGSSAGGVTDDLLDAVRLVETGHNPNQTSPSGAQGPYQLMPATAAQYGVKNAFDENDSRRAARANLNDLARKYGGDLAKTLAAHNWGPGNLDKDIAARGDDWRSGLPRETAAYIANPHFHIGGHQQMAGGTTTINQNGPVNITTQATDAQGIARGWHGAVVAQADSGPK